MNKLKGDVDVEIVVPNPEEKFTTFLVAGDEVRASLYLSGHVEFDCTTWRLHGAGWGPPSDPGRTAHPGATRPTVVVLGRRRCKKFNSNSSTPSKSSYGAGRPSQASGRPAVRTR